jgi:hypothetical protein
MNRQIRRKAERKASGLKSDRDSRWRDGRLAAMRVLRGATDIPHFSYRHAIAGVLKNLCLRARQLHMNFEVYLVPLGRGVGLLAITAALAACGGSAQNGSLASEAATTGVTTASRSVFGSPAVIVNTPRSVSSNSSSQGSTSSSSSGDSPSPPAIAGQTVPSLVPSPVTWQERLSGKPHIFAIDYIQPNQLNNGQSAEPVSARYPLVITGEAYAAPNPMTTYLDKLRSFNANIVLISYLNPLQDAIPESTGPGYDAMRYLETIESAYLHDARGNRLYVPGSSGKYAYFDPSSNDVRSAVLAAIQAMLTAYPFDGIFLDNYDVQNAMLLDTQGNQYLGLPGQVKDPADYAAKLAAMTTLATTIRDAWPNALIVANGNNAFPSFNGELVEGNGEISRVPAQAVAIAGRVLPFMPLFMDHPVSGPVDPLIATDMAQVQALGAWYGASVTYELVIWPAALGP